MAVERLNQESRVRQKHQLFVKYLTFFARVLKTSCLKEFTHITYIHAFISSQLLINILPQHVKLFFKGQF